MKCILLRATHCCINNWSKLLLRKCVAKYFASPMTQTVLGLPWYIQSFGDLQPCRPTFEPRPVHVGFIVLSGTGTNYYQRTSVFPYDYHSSYAPHSYFVHLLLLLHNLKKTTLSKTRVSFLYLYLSLYTLMSAECCFVEIFQKQNTDIQ